LSALDPRPQPVYK